jgi:hypothetical protein
MEASFARGLTLALPVSAVLWLAVIACVVKL